MERPPTHALESPDAAGADASSGPERRAKSGTPRKKSRQRRTSRSAEKTTLGDLEIFGVEQVWQLATILPKRYEDLRYVRVDFAALKSGEWVCLGGRGIACVAGQERSAPDAEDGDARAAGAAKRRHAVVIEDLGGRARVDFWIDEETAARRTLIAAANAGNAVWVHGCVRVDDAGIHLDEAESVLESELGEVQPVYPGRKRPGQAPRSKRGRAPPQRLTPAQVRQQLEPRLRTSIGHCSRVILKRLHVCDQLSEMRLMWALGSPGATVELTLKLAHRPFDEACGQAACAALERLVALEALMKVSEERRALPHKARVLALSPRAFADAVATVESCARMRLTQEQLDACVEILADLAGSRRTHRFLSGDVGTGKTLVFGVVAATVVAAGGLVVVLEPATALTAQIAQRLAGMFPGIPVSLLNSSSRDASAPLRGIAVGTTGMWRRLAGAGVVPDLVIADEQHKYGIRQRLPLELSDVANVLECTATAIPRTQALLEFGGMEVTLLRTSHIAKSVATEVIEDPASLGVLIAAVREDIERENKNLLIVLPSVHARHADDEDPDLMEVQAEEAFDDLDWTPEAINEVIEEWREALPGRVDAIHGKMDECDQLAALSRFESGASRVLIGTTILEVGLNLPQADMMMIFCPERLGVAAVHQLRGRLARQGGHGECYLVPGARATEAQRALMHSIAAVNDGYTLALMDMERRGSGDLRHYSNKQSGRYKGFLVGRSPDHESFAFVTQKCGPWIAERGDDPEILAERASASSNFRSALAEHGGEPTPVAEDGQFSLF